jgi:hypothetical protein
VSPSDEAPRRSWTIRRRLVVWLVGSLVGVAVLALPDADDRLFSLSRTHGPSPVDVLGMLVLVAAWLPVPGVLWRRRRALRGTAATVVAVLAVTGLGGLLVTVGLDLGAVYVVPVVVLLAAQMLALRVVARDGPLARPGSRARLGAADPQRPAGGGHGPIGSHGV